MEEEESEASFLGLKWCMKRAKGREKGKRTWWRGTGGGKGGEGVGRRGEEWVCVGRGGGGEVKRDFFGLMYFLGCTALAPNLFLARNYKSNCMSVKLYERGGPSCICTLELRYRILYIYILFTDAGIKQMLLRCSSNVHVHVQ